MTYLTIATVLNKKIYQWHCHQNTSNAHCSELCESPKLAQNICQYGSSCKVKTSDCSKSGICNCSLTLTCLVSVLLKKCRCKIFNLSENVTYNKHLWKHWVFAYQAYTRYAKCQWRQFMWRHKLLTLNLFLRPNLFCEGWQKYECLIRVCHWRFHDILPKEYSGTFPELLWGRWICYKKDANC